MRKLKRSECAVLSLVLKGKWYDMIERGEKKEEYRLVNDYWDARLMNWEEESQTAWKVAEFRRGYAADAPRMAFHVSRVRIRSVAVFKEWGEPEAPHFVIELGERAELKEEPVCPECGSECVTTEDCEPGYFVCAECGLCFEAGRKVELRVVPDPEDVES